MDDAPHVLRALEARRRLLTYPSHARIDGNEQVGGEQWGPDVMSLPLASHLVEIASAQGELILDPFGGVATTGVAASRMGRRFAGFETDPARHAAGKTHLPPESVWLNGSLAAPDTPSLKADALITSPPFGRKSGGTRVFDDRYFADMEAIFARAGAIVREGGVAIVELMNWPEFPGGENLIFRFFQFLSGDWSYVRELVFTTPNGSMISSIASHTWLTIWMRNETLRSPEKPPSS